VFAAGQAYRAHAQLASNTQDAGDLLVGEDLGSGSILDTIGGHAVDASQIVLVGQRDTLVGVDGSESVDQRPGRGYRGGGVLTEAVRHNGAHRSAAFPTANSAPKPSASSRRTSIGSPTDGPGPSASTASALASAMTLSTCDAWLPAERT
jgi:hypothetical protein